VNLSLFKSFRVTEKLRTEFRAETFNALNHTNLPDPSQTFSPRIATASPPRRLQFGVRISW
jgi:hypothetical protein